MRLCSEAHEPGSSDGRGLEDDAEVRGGLGAPGLSGRLRCLGTEHLFQAKVSLDEQVTELYEKGQCEQAIPLAEKVRELRLKRLGDKRLGYAAILNNLASLHKSMGASEKAGPLLREVVYGCL